jgi:hypothetical protein
MRAPRTLSLPIAMAVTFGLWYGFLWTMQHAPVSRIRAGSYEGNSRSQGGLANQFASAVVRFFDDQDPRSVPETGPADDDPLAAAFSGEIPEFLPLPPESREAVATELPELVKNPSLSSRNLFRSDVDLDGDGHLDLALLIRMSRSKAVGAVFSYVPKQRFQLQGEFRFAGKFECYFGGVQGFEDCFAVIRSGSGQMHIASRSLAQDPAVSRQTANAGEPLTQVAAWRMWRLHEEQLQSTGVVEDACVMPSRNRLHAVRDNDQDLLLHTTFCPQRACGVWRFEWPATADAQSTAVPDSAASADRVSASGGSEPIPWPAGHWVPDPESAALCEPEEPPADD